MSPDDPFDLTGEVLDGEYRVQSVVKPLDSKPVVIYRGDHLGVPIAIECLRLPPDIDADRREKAVEAFLEGGRLHHRLAPGHPAIVQTIAVGSRVTPRTGMIMPYLVREWLEGEPLAEELARPLTVRRVGRKLDEAMVLFEPVMEALGYAHAQSAAHLALGPRSLFLEARGDSKLLKILDFGTARAISTSLTSRRALAPEYTAPELQEGGGPDPGPPADVYAIARIMRDVLSGVDLPRKLERALSSATDRVPDRRPKDASRLWEEINASIRAPAAPSEPPSPNPSDPPPVHVISKPPPAHVEGPALPAVIVEGGAPVPARSEERTVLIESVVQARSRRKLALSVGGVLLLLAVSVVAFFSGAAVRRQQALAAKMAPSATVEPVPADSALAGQASALAGQASALAEQAADPPDSGAATVEAPPITPLARFSRSDAKAALDATAKDVARCKKGKNWGFAAATVVFGNDGSVSRVLVGSPFGGTSTGACVAEALQTAKMPPFGGKPGVVGYRFHVAQQ